MADGSLWTLTYTKVNITWVVLFGSAYVIHNNSVLHNI